MPADFEITAYEPNRRIGFRAIAGPVRPEGSYELEPTATAAPSSRSRLSCQPTGFGRVMTPMIAKTMRSEVTRLDRLREVLESGH